MWGHRCGKAAVLKLGVLERSRQHIWRFVYFIEFSRGFSDLKVCLSIGPDDEYAESASEGIIARLSGRLSSLVAFVRSSNQRVYPNYQNSSKSDTFAQDQHDLSEKVLDSRGPIMELILSKLKGFLILRFEEQLAVTGVVEKCICLLCSLTMASSGGSKRELGYLELVVEVMVRVDDLWNEAVGHLSRLPEYKGKLQAFKRALTSSKTELRKKKMLGMILLFCLYVFFTIRNILYLRKRTIECRKNIGDWSHC